MALSPCPGLPGASPDHGKHRLELACVAACIAFACRALHSIATHAEGRPRSATTARPACPPRWHQETADLSSTAGPSEDDSGNPEPTEPRARPESIGRYRVVGALDSGGQASVYRAVHPTLPRDLAIKIAHDSGEIDHRLLRADAELLCELDHPNLVRVYDLDVHEGRPFVAMEFVRGRNLHQVAEQLPTYVPRRRRHG